MSGVSNDRHFFTVYEWLMHMNDNCCNDLKSQAAATSCPAAAVLVVFGGNPPGVGLVDGERC